METGQEVAKSPGGVASHIFEALAPDLGQQIPIVNYHFVDVNERRAFRTKVQGGFHTHYHIKGAKTMKDCPGIFVVMDALERTYMGAKKWGSNFEDTTAPQIANDLVRCGTGGEPGDASTILPAVWKSEAPDTPRTPQAYAVFQGIWPDEQERRRQFPLFSAEIERYRARQYQWCELNIRIADQLHAEHAGRDFKRGLEIGPKHRNSALWIGANPLEHPWMDQTMFGKQKPCPICATVLPSEAVFCGNCKTIIDPARHAAILAKLPGQAPEKDAWAE